MSQPPAVGGGGGVVVEDEGWSGLHEPPLAKEMEANGGEDIPLYIRLAARNPQHAITGS